MNYCHHTWLGASWSALLLWMALTSACFALDTGQPQVRTASDALALTGKHARVESGQQFFGDGNYAGSQSCKGCHEAQYRSWAASWHSKMERWPSPDSVVGAFDNRLIQFRDLRVRGQDGKESTISPTASVFREDDRFFFTLIDRDDAKNNQTWEVAKVLGGKWDQGYEVRLGADNYFPAPIRWALEQQDWIVGGFNPQDWFVADGTRDGRPFRPEEMPVNRVAEAKCNGCHTTGFVYAKADDGIWKSQAKGQAEIAIACESCHGPGSRHVDEAHAAESSGAKLLAGRTAIVNPLTDLNAEQATQVCGQCHGRGTHKDKPDLSFPTGFLPGDTDLKARFRLWSYSSSSSRTETDYFWSNDWASRNRQQYQDFARSGHATKAGMSCLTCHAFHGKTEPSQLRSKAEALCVECHRAEGQAAKPNAEMFANSPHAEVGVTCVDCHMARIGSRSRATSKAGHRWDTTSHVFAVATPWMEKTLGVRSACVSCHFDVDSPPDAPDSRGKRQSTRQSLIGDMQQRSAEVRSSVAETQAMLANLNPRDETTSELLNAARSKLAFVVMDNSKGMHNIALTRRLLEDARALAMKASAKSRTPQVSSASPSSRGNGAP